MPKLIFPRFLLDNFKVYLQDINEQPIALWDIKKRLSEAEENIAKIADHSHTAILIGIEHIAYAKKILDQNIPVIIIEKSASYLETFFNWFPEYQQYKDRIPCVVGEYGFCSPRCTTQIQPSFFYQELGLLSYQINQTLRQTQATQIQIYSLQSHSIEKQFHQLLKRCLLTIQVSRQFHQRNEERYHNIRAQKSTDHLLILMNQNDDKPLLKRSVSSLYPDHKQSYHSFNRLVQAKDYYQIFGGQTLDENLLDASTVKELTQPYEKRAIELLDQLSSSKPTLLGWHNRSIFLTLEDILFTEEMLYELQIPTASFFIDWTTQQFNGFQGGWNFDLHCHFTKNQNQSFFSLFPFHASFSQPESVPTYALPYQYTGRFSDMRKPLKKGSDFRNDIAIIHTTQQAAFGIEEMNELYQMILAMSPLSPRQATAAFLVSIRSFLKQAPDPLFYSFVWKSLLHHMDYATYQQLRIQEVVHITKELEKDFRIQVYGQGWEQYLPRHLCHDPISYEELRDVWQSSITTLELSVTYSIQNPNLPVVECLMSGGYPILAQPSLEDTLLLGDKCFNENNLIHFSDLSDLKRKVENCRSNLEGRTQYIESCQAGWLTDKQEQERSAASSQRTADFRRIPSIPHNISLTNDPVKDSFLLMTSVGYLYQLMGYSKIALELWMDTIQQTSISYLPLIGRALNISQEIGDHNSHDFFNQLAQAYYGKRSTE